MNNSDKIEYDYALKMDLHDHIEKIRSIWHLKKIKLIIEEHNPDLNILKNSNGYYLQFQNLTNETYILINEYLLNIESKIIKSPNIILDSSEQNTSEQFEKNGLKKYKLTNTENHILNRVKYENELKKNDTLNNEPCENFNFDAIKIKPRKK